MAVTFTGAGTAVAASGTGQAVTTATAFAVGDYLVAFLAYDNSATTPSAGADPMTGTIGVSPATGALGASVSAQTGLNDPGAVNAGLCIRVVAFPVTTTIPTSTVVTLSWTGTVTVRVAALMKVSASVGTLSYRINSGLTGGNTVNATASTALVTPSVLSGEGVLCWAATENGAAIVGDADTTNGSWSTVYGNFTGSGIAGMAAYFQSKVVTGTATQSFSGTSGAVSSDWITGCLIFTENPSITQAAYRFYDDAGTESGANPLAALNTAVIGNVDNGDGYGVLRIRLQSTNAIAVAATDDFQLQWELNFNGTWTNVTAASTTVQGYNNPNLADTAATTNRLGAGTGTFVAGKISEDGLADDVGWSANNYTELVYSLKLLRVGFVNGDTLRLRVVRNGSTSGMTYTQVPTVSLSGPTAPVRTQLAQQIGNLGNTNSSGAVTPTTGSRITIRAMWNNGGGTGGTCVVSDTAGNVWDISLQSQRGSAGAGIFWCNSHVGGTTTITVTNSNTGDMMFACQYDYWQATAGFGAKGVGDNDANPPADLVVTMTGTAPTVNDYVIGAMSFDEFQPSVAQATGNYTTDLYGRQVSSSAGQFMLYLASRRLTDTSLNYVFDLVSGDEFGEVGAALVILGSGGASLGQGFGTISNTFNPVATGKKAPRSTVIGSFSFDLTVVSLRTSSGSATTNYADDPAAVGKRAPKTINLTTAYAEDSVATGKRDPKGSAPSGNYAETLTAQGKRSPRSDITASNTWIPAAIGAKPVVGTKQGAGTVAYSYDFTAAAGKRLAKSTVVIDYAEDVVATGKKLQKSLAAAVGWAMSLLSQGKRTPTSIVTTTTLQTPAVTGKRVPRTASVTLTNDWTGVAQGAAPVVGTKQGSGLSAFSFDPVASGKRPPKGGNTFSWNAAVTAAGKQTPKGAASSLSYTEVSSAVGKRVARSTLTTTYFEDTVALGKRVPRASGTGVHTWTQFAQGFAPIVGAKQGTAFNLVRWDPVAAGKHVSKGFTVGNALWVPTAAGKRPQKGAGSATTLWVPSVAGKKLPRSAVVVVYVEHGVAVGRRVPKGRGVATDVYVLTAKGGEGLLGLVEMYANGQHFVAMQFEGKAVVDYLLVPSP